MRDLPLPLDEATARSLALGEMVTVSGPLFTGRSRFHIRAVEEDLYPPIDYSRINTFFHVGPVMKRGEDGWEVVSVEPTSSIRFERYGADVVRKFGLRALIGKTTMGPRTAEALREVGGVYLSKIGLSGNALRQRITGVLGVHFVEELGKTEATWIFEVERFGPFFVAIDARGRDYFREYAPDTAKAAARLGIPEDFKFTDVGGKENHALCP